MIRLRCFVARGKIADPPSFATLHTVNPRLESRNKLYIPSEHSRNNITTITIIMVSFSILKLEGNGTEEAHSEDCEDNKERHIEIKAMPRLLLKGKETLHLDVDIITQ